MENQDEVFFNCPYCFEQISMIFEGDYGGQKYIEDCEVCCNPIEINYEINEGAISLNSVSKAD